MVRAWLYLLQAEFQRDGVDQRHKDRDGNIVMKDKQAKLWDVFLCAKYSYPNANHPVRANLDLFVLLRNKVEHRFEQALKEVAGGRAHALVINYEQRIRAVFGDEHSLANRLRLPLFVESHPRPLPGR